MAWRTAFSTSVNSVIGGQRSARAASCRRGAAERRQAITLGLFTYGGKKWPKMRPWNIGREGFSLFAVLSIIAMVPIFFLGVQPPNALAFRVTIGFFILTAIAAAEAAMNK
jgi:hypothetical protein